MPQIFALLQLALGVFNATSPSTLSNNPILANLRIEGQSKTIFEGTVKTHGHDITKGGVTHVCDGTNNHAHPSAGPTATSALDDASKLGSGFAWDAKYYVPPLDDFMVTSIAGESPSPSQYWALFVNYYPAQVGGCQRQIKATDHVLWALVNQQYTQPTMQLTGPTTAKVNVPFTLTVTYGCGGEPVPSATVGGSLTNDQGQVTVTPTSAGDKTFKAEKTGAVRSNRLTVKVS